VDRLVPPGTVPVPSRSAPARRRPPELDDADWIRKQLAEHGEQAIAEQLGVARGTVRASRIALGIEAASLGRRRGVPSRTTPKIQSVTVQRVIAQVNHDRGKTIPTWNTVLQHLAVADRARRNHNRTAEQSAAIALSATTALLAEHLTQLP
jgi:hypothetical protein